MALRFSPSTPESARVLSRGAAVRVRRAAQAAFQAVLLLTCAVTVAQETPPREHAAEQQPDAETLYRQGRAARLAGEMGEAIDRLRRASGLEPDNADIAVELGLAYAATRKFDAARDAFGKALKIVPNYDDAELGLARARFWNGEVDAADAALKPLLQRSPDNAEAKALADQIAAARKEASAARPPGAASTPKVDAAKSQNSAIPIAAALKAVSNPPRQVSLDSARALRRRGKFPEAEAVYKRVLAAHPRDVDLLVDIGLMQAFQGEKRFADARATFEKAVAVEPKSIDARLGLARVDLYTGALDRADTAVTEILAQKPDYTDALSLRAQIRLARHDARGAERDFTELAKRDPKDSDALVGLGDAVREQYRDEEALAIYRRAHGLAPDSRDIEKRLELPARPRWRLDLDGNYSRLSRGFDAWREGSAHLGYIIDERTTVTIGSETDYRFRRFNTLIDGRIDNRWSSSLSSYVRIGGSPNASYRPSLLAEIGGSVEIWKGVGFLGATQATLDLGISHYRGQGDVRSFNPGIAQYFADGRFRLSAKFIGTLATNDDRLAGYSIRGDALLTDKLSVFIGYADAPDNSDGLTVPSKAIYGGLSYDVSDRLSVRVSVAHEDRINSYARTTYSLGLTARY